MAVEEYTNHDWTIDFYILNPVFEDDGSEVKKRTASWLRYLDLIIYINFKFLYKWKKIYYAIFLNKTLFLKMIKMEKLFSTQTVVCQQIYKNRMESIKCACTQFRFSKFALRQYFLAFSDKCVLS